MADQHARAGAFASAARDHPASYRPDIDGLRAIAVTAVVIYHAAANLLPSGYVGVDIFFAISGYLIGGIIVREVEAGCFSLTEFYARRARRILPALIALVVVCSAAGIALMASEWLIRFGKEALAALTGTANLYYWFSTDYFEPRSAERPFLMTWSLGVEEQFYLIFPWLILALAQLSHRRRLMVMAALCAVSLTASVMLTFSYPLFAFYQLPARAWELGSGAMLALGHRHGQRSFSRGRSGEALSAAGLLLVIASLLVFDDATPFPGFAAVLPVTGTLLLLHTDASLINRHVLAARPMVVVGLVSYSWYLWHWPILAFSRAMTDRAPTSVAMAFMVALSFFVAVASWWFVERPFRRQVHAATKTAATQTLVRYAAATAMAGLIPAALIASHGWPQRLDPATQKIEASRTRPNPCLRQFESDVPVMTARCAPHGAQVALLGDSHAAALAPGLQEALEKRGQSLLQVEKAACLPLAGVTAKDTTRKAHAALCGRFLARAARKLAANRVITTVVIAGSWPNVGENARFHRYHEGRVGERLSARDAVSQGLPPLIAELKNAGKRVIVVGDVPRFTIDTYKHALIASQATTSQIARALDGSLAYPDNRIPMNALDPAYTVMFDDVRAIATRSGVGFVEVRDILCAGQGCRFMEGGLPLFLDQHHLSHAGSRVIPWDDVLQLREASR